MIWIFCILHTNWNNLHNIPNITSTNKLFHGDNLDLQESRSGQAGVDEHSRDGHNMDSKTVADVTIAADAQEELVRKNGVVLFVWKYFSLSCDNNQMTKFCKLYQAKVVAAGSKTNNSFHCLSKHVLWDYN